jgi:type II secretory pathway component PulF
MMSLRNLGAFCRRMGIGLRSGVDILRLLDNETKSGDKRQRATMLRVHDKIRSGNTLAKSMLEEGKYFPPLLIQMVNASEIGGRTESMFAYMADYYDRLRKTRALFIGQITWPLIQLVMAVTVVGLLILIQGILSPNSGYDAAGFGLRGLQGFYIYCLTVGATFLLAFVAGYWIWKNWFGCHKILVPLVQKIPVLGTAFITLGLSRLSMTLSMLLNAGVEAKRSIKQAFLSTGNYYFISGMDRAVEAIGRGASFGDAFDESKVLPDEFVETVRIGELSGTETESLDHLAQQYQERSEGALRTIAMIASTTIWIGVMLMLAFLIIRMAMQYINMLNSFL